MRSVSVKELTDWIDKNKNHTWSFNDPDYLDKTLRMKYINFSIDTRDMNVWMLTIRGIGDEFYVRDDNKEDGKTILDAAQEFLDKE